MTSVKSTTYRQLQRRDRILVIGHRGLGANAREADHLPENTLPSFLMAFIDGADMVELDVTMTWDNVPVIIHDDLLDRTTNGAGHVQNHTLDSLISLDAAKGTSFTGVHIRISTLTEIIALILDRYPETSLNIELKTLRGSRQVHEYRHGIVHAVISTLRQYNVSSRVVVSSFDLRLLIMTKRMAPFLCTALLGAPGKTTIPSMIKAASHFSFDGLHPHISLLHTKNDILRIHEAGLFVQPYTLNTRDEFARAMYLGVDGIITDRPEVLRDFLMHYIP